MGNVQTDLYLAIKDFEAQTFESMRQGLKEMGELIRSIPSLMRDCKSIRADLANLEELANILAHPLSLMFRAGKNFLVNGVDILKKYNLGW